MLVREAAAAATLLRIVRTYSRSIRTGARNFQEGLYCLRNRVWGSHRSFGSGRAGCSTNEEAKASRRHVYQRRGGAAGPQLFSRFAR